MLTATIIFALDQHQPVTKASAMKVHTDDDFYVCVYAPFICKDDFDHLTNEGVYFLLIY